MCTKAKFGIVCMICQNLTGLTKLNKSEIRFYIHICLGILSIGNELGNADMQQAGREVFYCIIP